MFFTTFSDDIAFCFTINLFIQAEKILNKEYKN